MRGRDGLSSVVAVSLAVVTVFVWWNILFAKAEGPHVYFLDVGQGDAALTVLEDGVQILTDAGPNRRILDGLGRAMDAEDKYIDLAILTHPQMDHFGGFNFVLDHYDIGAFLFNGRIDRDLRDWKELLKKLEDKNIPLIVLRRGDSISYKNSKISVLMPTEEYARKKELNNTGIITLAEMNGFKILSMADAGMSVEKEIMVRFELGAHVLKVGHHGSKFSSDSGFLQKIAPRVSVIGVGERNPYGHPTREVLGRLRTADSEVFRTDLSGSILVKFEDNKLKIFAQKSEPVD